jgi:hypothetical protein
MRTRTTVVLVVLVGLAMGIGAVELWGQKARVKKLPPPITKPVFFNTPEADRIMVETQVFPSDNPWNWDISYYPLLRNSKEMIATIGTDGKLAWNPDM